VVDDLTTLVELRSHINQISDGDVTPEWPGVFLAIVSERLSAAAFSSAGTDSSPATPFFGHK